MLIILLESFLYVRVCTCCGPFKYKSFFPFNASLLNERHQRTHCAMQMERKFTRSATIVIPRSKKAFLVSKLCQYIEHHTYAKASQELSDHVSPRLISAPEFAPLTSKTKSLGRNKNLGSAHTRLCVGLEFHPPECI
jgi:hypothetical protein